MDLLSPAPIARAEAGAHLTEAGPGTLVTPYGGTLRVLDLPADQAARVRGELPSLPAWDLTPRQLCDLDLLLNGAFSPLTGFLDEADYVSVLRELRLADGTLWPMPITLDVSEEFAARAPIGARIALRDPEGVPLAVLTVTSVYRPDLAEEARSVLGTDDEAHPGAAHLLRRTKPVYLGGPIEGLSRPVFHDFLRWRDDPTSLRARLSAAGWTRVVAFQTRNPMHRAHQELTLRAAAEAGANLLIHPVTGLTKPGDIDHYSRVRGYERLLARYQPGTATLSLLNLAMRMAGPREALWHALIRRNHGVSHFIVGRDHAGPGKDSRGRDVYGPYDAQELVRAHEAEIGVTMVPFRELVHVPGRGHVPADQVREGEQVLNLSGTEFRRRLIAGEEIPEWFSFPEVVDELRRTHKPPHEQGLVVFFTGLSGAGKSTVANGVMARLLEAGGRSVTLLDGDLVRKSLSSELGFSREHRNLNVLRIGYVASEIARAGGIALCAPIAPYADIRAEVRETVRAAGGNFVEVHVATPLDVCERRDRKGLYAKARAGLVKQVTGIDDPYEVPTAAELTLDTSALSVQQAVDQVIAALRARGYLA